MGLKEDIQDLICNALDVGKDEVVLDKKLYDSIGIDSTEVVELVVSLNKKYGIRIEPNEVTKFSTPDDIASVVEKKQK